MGKEVVWNIGRGSVDYDEDQDFRFLSDLNEYINKAGDDLMTSGRRNDDMVNLLILLSGCNPRRYKYSYSECKLTLAEILTGTRKMPEEAEEHFDRIYPYLKEWIVQDADGIADYDIAVGYGLV